MLEPILNILFFTTIMFFIGCIPVVIFYFFKEKIERKIFLYINLKYLSIGVFLWLFLSILGLKEKTFSNFFIESILLSITSLFFSILKIRYSRSKTFFNRYSIAYIVIIFLFFFLIPILPE